MRKILQPRYCMKNLVIRLVWIANDYYFTSYFMNEKDVKICTIQQKMMNEKDELMIEILTQTALTFMIHCVMFITNGAKNRYETTKFQIINIKQYKPCILTLRQ